MPKESEASAELFGDHLGLQTMIGEGSHVPGRARLLPSYLAATLGYR